ncbi:uncharacterized protein [Dipodomys merriami]|uniref:uncharacterized protein n=1 Tax=Dipodomys merriami TaxID=94247 RepID=UPI00384E3FD2
MSDEWHHADGRPAGAPTCAGRSNLRRGHRGYPFPARSSPRASHCLADAARARAVPSEALGIWPSLPRSLAHVDGLACVPQSARPAVSGRIHITASQLLLRSHATPVSTLMEEGTVDVPSYSHGEAGFQPSPTAEATPLSASQATISRIALGDQEMRTLRCQMLEPSKQKAAFSAPLWPDRRHPAISSSLQTYMFTQKTGNKHMNLMDQMVPIERGAGRGKAKIRLNGWSSRCRVDKHRGNSQISQMNKEGASGWLSWWRANIWERIEERFEGQLSGLRGHPRTAAVSTVLFSPSSWDSSLPGASGSHL